MNSKPRRPQHTATVTSSRWLSPTLVRLSFDCPAIKDMDPLQFTDHYVKLNFSPADHPPDQRPITRTYTLRHIDQTAGTFTIDFVAHGTEGLAGPWAGRATPGEQLNFMGPGGAWAPSNDYSHFVFAGDESAIPAICAGLEALPHGATAEAYLEIPTAEHRCEMPELPAGISVHWVERNGQVPGAALVDAVTAAPFTPGSNWFIHGVAEMIRDLRRYLFVEMNVAKQDVSISGYWRLGMTEGEWQATKKEFLTSIEAEEQAAKDCE